MKTQTPNAYAKVVTELLIERGTQEVLIELMKALHSFMYVTASTEVEAFTLWSERAQTDRLKEHWKGRQEAAWSIRRHCGDQADQAMKLLEKLVPQGAWGKSGRDELRKRLQQARATAKKTIALRAKNS